MGERYQVTVGAGSLTPSGAAVVRFPHRWTADGVGVEAQFSGAHLLHLAAAGCVLNDVYREAARLGIEVDGVRVVGAGGYHGSTWHSEGIEYAVEVASGASAEQLTDLLRVVDAVAEIPRAIRSGASVSRVG